jgi:hypothetical protein
MHTKSCKIGTLTWTIFTKHRGRDTALDQNCEQQILDWSKQNRESKIPIPKKEIKDYCTSQFSAAMTRSEINVFVLRFADEIIQMKRRAASASTANVLWTNSTGFE